MLTIPFTALTRSTTQPLIVYTARSLTSAQASVNGEPVFLEQQRMYRFLDLLDGWAHLDSHIGFVPMSYLDPATIRVDELSYLELSKRYEKITAPIVFPTDSIIVPVQRTFTTDVIARSIIAKPNHTYSSNDIRTIVSLYYTYAFQVGVDWVVALAQAIHETDWFRSWWSAPPRRNMAGIGVTGESASTKPAHGSWVYNERTRRWYRGYVFDSLDSAVKNHIALLLIYASQTFSETQEALVAESYFRNSYRRHPYRGLCSRWVDLNGRWAVPGTTYAQRIATIATSLLEKTVKAEQQSP